MVLVGAVSLEFERYGAANSGRCSASASAARQRVARECRRASASGKGEEPRAKQPARD